MKDLEAGTLVIMVKNEDGSFSPIAMSRGQAYIINAFLGRLSKESPLIVGAGKYVEVEQRKQNK